MTVMTPAAIRKPPPDIRLTAPQIEARRSAVLATTATEHGRALALHWLDAAEDRIAPAKSSIRPEMLGRSLSRIIIYDFESPEVIRFRLAGSHFYSIHGRELTGTNFLEMMESDSARSAASRRLCSIIQHPCGLVSDVTTSFASGRTGVFRALGFPLVDNEGRLGHSIHISEYMGAARLPEFGALESLSPEQAKFVDLGLGVPDYTPPF